MADHVHLYEAWPGGRYVDCVPVDAAPDWLDVLVRHDRKWGPVVTWGGDKESPTPVLVRDGLSGVVAVPLPHDPMPDATACGHRELAGTSGG